jgi:drug/metabolite transporter (DMT)-like permease
MIAPIVVDVRRSPSHRPEARARAGHARAKNGAEVGLKLSDSGIEFLRKSRASKVFVITIVPRGTIVRPASHTHPAQQLFHVEQLRPAHPGGERIVCRHDEHAEQPQALTTPRVTHLGAIGLALAGFTFWVLADTSMKLAGNSRLPAYEIVACQALVVAAAIALRAIFQGNAHRLRTRNPQRLVVRAGLDLANNLCVVIALRHLPLTLFYILVFLAPMVTALLTGIFLREHLGWRKIAAVAGGFAGVVVAVNPFRAARQGDWVGYAACMVCVLCFSANMVWSRVLMRTETPESLTLFSGAVQFVACACLMALHAEPVTPRLTVTLAAMGLFCAFGSMCFFVALQSTSPVHVSQCHYTQLVTGALLTWLIWREVPTYWMMAGSVLIVAAGLLMASALAREHSAVQPEVFVGPG